MKERITRQEIEAYKREILENTVLVDVREAAKILSCSSSTVHALIREERITAYNRHGVGRPCNGTRILASELRAYVNSIRINADRYNE